VAAVRARPADAAVLLDFDGTLSPTVADPAAARAAPGAAEALDALVARGAAVGIVSGRPVEFLAPLLPATVAISGQYGLELRAPGAAVRLTVDGAWRDAVADASVRLGAGAPPGVLVEPKGLSITVHHRNAPEAAGWVRARVAEVAAATGLEPHPAKASMELRPPAPFDKGTVVTDLAGDAATVLYAGDDVGDLPAFAAVARLRTAGRLAVAVAAAGPELPEPVRAAADATVDGPPGVVDLLHRLLG